MPKLKYTKVKENACSVSKGTPHSAAFDLIADEDIYLVEGTEITIDTGLVFNLEEFGPEYHLLVLSRSSSAKHGFRIKNIQGLIDYDYRGITDTLKVVLYRDSIEVRHTVPAATNGMLLSMEMPGQATSTTGMTLMKKREKTLDPLICKRGEAFAQVLVQRHEPVELDEVAAADWPDYGDRGGFGSTNK